VLSSQKHFPAVRVDFDRRDGAEPVQDSSEDSSTSARK
jgi:hypothetical protein